MIEDFLVNVSFDDVLITIDKTELHVQFEGEVSCVGCRASLVCGSGCPHPPPMTAASCIFVIICFFHLQEEYQRHWVSLSMYIVWPHLYHMV